MTVIATIGVPAEDFTFGGALTANPGIGATLERVVPLGSTFVPYFWASDESVEAIERALRAEADIESFEIVDRVNGEALVRVEWKEDLDGLLDAIVETGATILQGVGRDDTWTFQLRFDDHEDLTAFYRQCVERGIGIDLLNVHNPGLPRDLETGIDMTDTQYETLQTALEQGYFDVPRGINLTDLAAELGVSDTAVSQRIRRGISALLATTLAESGEEARE